MAVNDLHPEYLGAMAQWARARDVIAGEDAVKAAGVRYLPKLDSQSDAEYAAYKQRASFFNATARTSDGYVGLIFRRPPFLKVPENGSALASAIAGFRNDADMLGTPLVNYAKEVVREVIEIGRAGTLVDWEGDVENRAFVSLYPAEHILNWRVERVNGRNVPVLVVLYEVLAHGHFADGHLAHGGAGDEDGFESRPAEQIRVLRLVDGGSLMVDGEGRGETPAQPAAEDGYATSETPAGRSATGATRGGAAAAGYRGTDGPVCVVEVWRPCAVDGGSLMVEGGKRKWSLVERRVPLRLGKPLPLLPFVFHGATHSQPAIGKVPLSDIIAVNLDHYRLDADYKHGVHYTALPTAWVSGFGKDAQLRIGSSIAWMAESTGATAGFLEFTGQGLTTFERAMDRDERLMAILGSRLLESQKRVGETAQAIELRQNGENSILGSIAVNVSASLTQVLRWVYWWNSTEESPEDVTSEDVAMELNTDFSTKGLSAQEIQAVVAAWQAGAISRDSMTELFRRGEVLPEGRTVEEEEKLIGRNRTDTK